MTASQQREFMNYMDLIFSLMPSAFTVKIPRGSTSGSRSRYYDLYSEQEVRNLLRDEQNIEYIKFSRAEDFYGTIYPEDRYLKISFDSPEHSRRFWNVLHSQNLGTYEVAVRMTTLYFMRLRDDRRPLYQ
jgi:hypothetical protein